MVLRLQHWLTCARDAYARRSGRRLVHLLHIGKTGGTAVKHALRQAPRSGRQHLCLHGHHVRLSDIPVGESVIFFVRDPVARFVSGFFSRQRQGMPRYRVPWTPGERDAFTTFTTPRALAEALSDCDCERRRQAEAAMRGIRHVRDSYWNWFDSEAYLLTRQRDILFVGRQETLTADFDLLRRLLHLPDSLSLPISDKDSHKAPSDLDKSLTDLAITNLRCWYQRDYDFLTWCDTHLHTRDTIASAE